jgi:hypothetical protein
MLFMASYKMSFGDGIGPRYVDDSYAIAWRVSYVNIVS